jgi:hypothetical protein
MTRWPGAVRTPCGAVAGPCRALREVGYPVAGVPGLGGCSCPLAAGVGHGHSPFVQQSAQRHATLGTPTVLDDDAARMGRLADDGGLTAAPCTYDTSSRIHSPTVSVHHGERDRWRIQA